MKRALLILLWPGWVAAAGLSTPVIGTSLSGPASRDAAAVAWNPAVLGMLSGRSLMLGSSLLYLREDYARERRARYQHGDSLRFQAPIPSADLDPTRTGSASAVQAGGLVPLPAPQAFGAISLGRGWSAGLGIFAPFGAVLSFPDDGPQRYALQEVDLMVVEVAPAVAWRASERLALGGGVSLVGGRLRLRKVVDLASTPLLRDLLGEPPIGQPNDFGPEAPASVRELDVLSRPVTVTGWELGWAARLGVAWAPTPAWLLGASYVHRTALEFEGDFSLNLDDPFFTEDLAAQGLRYPSRAQGAATVVFPLPSSLNLGATWREGTWEAGVAGAWFRHSMVDALGVTLRSKAFVQPELDLLADETAVSLPRRWQDTIQVDGRLVWHGEGARLGGVAGLHTGASPDATLDVASPDGLRIIGALSGDAVLWRGWSVSGDLHVQRVLPRENSGSDYDLGNGTYSLWIVALTGGLSRSWD